MKSTDVVINTIVLLRWFYFIDIYLNNINCFLYSILYNNKKDRKKSQILLIHRFMFNIYKSTFPAKNTQIWQNNSLDPFFLYLIEPYVLNTGFGSVHIRALG